MQELEGTQAFLSLEQDKASISSLDLSKQFLDDTQGLSTLACMTFIVLCVFWSKDEELQQDRDKRSSKKRSLSILQNLSLLTITLVCGLPHFGEVDEDENSSRSEVEGEQ